MPTQTTQKSGARAALNEHGTYQKKQGFSIRAAIIHDYLSNGPFHLTLKLLFLCSLLEKNGLSTMKSPNPNSADQTPKFGESPLHPAM